MPDIDRTMDIKVNADRGMVTAEIPLAGHASEHWRELFGKLTPHGMQGSRAEAEEREDRTWVVVWLSPTRLDFHPEPTLDAASALISQVNGEGKGWQPGPAKSRPPSAAGGRGSKGSGQPAARPDPLLTGRFAQRVSLPLRRSAGVSGCPGVTVSCRRWPADRARNGHGTACTTVAGP